MLVARQPSKRSDVLVRTPSAHAGPPSPALTLPSANSTTSDHAIRYVRYQFRTNTPPIPNETTSEAARQNNHAAIVNTETAQKAATATAMPPPLRSSSADTVRQPITKIAALQNIAYQRD
jgi:hypothetical protein